MTTPITRNYVNLGALVAKPADPLEIARKVREARVARPMHDGELTIYGDLVLALRGRYGAPDADEVAADIADHFAGAFDGHADWLDLLRAVEAKDADRARAALERALASVAKYRYEQEVK